MITHFYSRFATGALVMGLFLLLAVPAQAQEASDAPVRVLFIGAHPDDCDVKAAGTAALMAEAGHAVKFVSLTNGDAGHYEMGGGPLAKRRRAESKEAARRLGIDAYEVLHYHDGELMPTLDVRHDVIRLIREWDANVVVGHRPNDYHPDHRYAGRVVQDAAYMVQVPNVLAKVEPTGSNPVFLYFQDRFQKPYPFQYDITVAIDEAIDTKMAALDAHDSQFYEWLPWIGNALDEVPEGEAARKAWLKERWTGPVSDDAKEGLAQWYDAERVQQVQYTEAFQVAEYGTQPSDEEIRRLFPMLGE
jgi:LmbE family N-acetylglucosaminyl deacetylase